MIRNVLRTVATDIALPLAAFFALTAVGLKPVWALAIAAGVSVIVLGIEWTLTRHLSTLGILVLVRFGLGIVVALITGDARLVLAKDYVITAGIAAFAAATLRMKRPFIACIRRELTPDPERFDREWNGDEHFRRQHARLTWMWVAGLGLEVAIALLVIAVAPLTAAVVITNVLTPSVLLTLIGITQVIGHRAGVRADQHLRTSYRDRGGRPRFP